jgi:hypothetical protein
LHEFLVTFGLDRSTQVGGVKMDARHRHTSPGRRRRATAPNLRKRPMARHGCAAITCR